MALAIVRAFLTTVWGIRQIVKIFERILYAANDVEAKQVIAEAQTHFASVLADAQ